jgi:hypothetical protein
MRIPQFFIFQLNKIIDTNIFEQNKIHKSSLYEDLFEYRTKKPHITKLVRKLQRDRVSLYNLKYHKRKINV